MRQRQTFGGSNSDANASTSNDNGITQTARRALKRVDVYQKMHTEFKVQTEFGATISIVAGIIMLILFLSEFSAYLTTSPHEHMVVDSTIAEKLPIHIDISFLALNCREAHLNAMDVAGDLQMNMHHSIFKTRLSPIDGKPIGDPITMTHAIEDKLPEDYCGSCYGATHPTRKACCQTCDEVKEAFINSNIGLEEADSKEQCIRESSPDELKAKEGEGCRFTGQMMVNRVAGNFHVALGRTFHRGGRLVHQFRPGQERTYNSSHLIHSISFGKDHLKKSSMPLDGVQKTTRDLGGYFQYFIKIVPTIYGDISDTEVASYQYSYTQQELYMDVFGELQALPGVFFVYDLSPFMVKIESDRIPFTHFLTSICAIVGGVVSISGFVDSFIYNSLHVRKGVTAATSTTKFG